MLNRILLTVALVFLVRLPAQAEQNECVVLLHGLGRTHISMLQLKLALSSDFSVVNLSYPSTKKTIEELVYVVEEGLSQCRKQQPSRIHFVTHSMGGILVRKYFQDKAPSDVGRVVMLAPPNHGSEIANHYRDTWWYKLLTGPAGQELGTEQTSVPNSLKPISLEIGVIAGTRSSDPWFSGVIEGSDDGKVSTASAGLEEMKDFLLVQKGHTFMTNSFEVIEQVRHFLKSGQFKK
jgi:pimeloyl-ACP methyl ester carboxylesterase